MKYCITCQTANDDYATRCRICNGIFFTNTTTQGTTSSNTSQILCSNCKRYISVVGFVCPHCGYSIESSQRDMNVTRHLKLSHKSGRVIILSNNDIIGRSFNGKEILKSDYYASRTHIKVKQVGKYFELKDLSSGNGFFVNMNPIIENGTAIVSTGDIVKIGVTDFMVEIITP